MIRGAMYTTIKTLWERGKNKMQIAEITGHDWKTISKVIKNIEKGIDAPLRKPHPKMLDKHKEEVLKFLEEDLSAVRIHEELQAIGLKIGYSTVKSFVADIKKREDIFVRIHTLPGEEAQVDFGYVGITLDENGKKRKTWVFNMRLSYSRLDYYEKVYDQKVETFIECHINAFNYFGGVPQYVKIDNLKAAILQVNFYEPIYQQLYKNFSEHYGFSIQPCRVYRPNDKGKVESGIDYVKKNFFKGRKFKNSSDLDKQLKNWLDNKANKRIHGTTKKIPIELFTQEEENQLKPLPSEKFKLVKVGKRKVYHDCHIYVNHNYYSVPFEYVGKEVDIEIGHDLLKISFNGNQIAIHPAFSGKGNFSTTNSHYPKYKMYSDTEYQEKYQAKMSALGSFAEQLFFLTMKNKPTDWYKTIQGILSLTKNYTPEIVNLACKRALAYNVCHYSVIKNICFNGSYLLPVEMNFEEEENFEYSKN